MRFEIVFLVSRFRGWIEGSGKGERRHCIEALLISQEAESADCKEWESDLRVFIFNVNRCHQDHFYNSITNIPDKPSLLFPQIPYIYQKYLPLLI